MWHEFITGCLKAEENLRAIYQEILKAKADGVDSVSVAEEGDSQQITEGRTSIQKEDGKSLCVVELTDVNKADGATDTASTERYNTYSSGRYTIEVNRSNVVSDTSKKRPIVENEKETVIENNASLRKPNAKNHSLSHIMLNSCHSGIEGITGVITQPNSDCEFQIKNGTVQNTGNTVTATVFDKRNTSNTEYHELQKDTDQTITEVSREKQMHNLRNSEHNKAGEFKKQRECDKHEDLDHGKCCRVQSDVEHISNQNGGTMKQNPAMGFIEKCDVSKREKKSFCCNDCGKVFFQKDCFLRHLRIHTDERPFTCHICGKGFRDSGGLTRHLRDVHARVKNFKCDICGSLFAAKATCDDHRRTHTGERPFVCAICGKCFGSKASHYMHVKTHTDVFPYNCNFCEKRFRRRQELLIHKMTHTGERPCACDICGREFRVSGELQRHKFVHSEDKPYSCTVCGMSFKQKRYLGNHVKRIHLGL